MILDKMSNGECYQLMKQMDLDLFSALFRIKRISIASTSMYSGDVVRSC